MTRVPVRPSFDDSCEDGDSGIDAGSSQAGGNSCEAWIGIMLEAFPLFDLLEASVMLVRSSCDPISPASAYGKSQVAARLY